MCIKSYKLYINSQSCTLMSFASNPKKLYSHLKFLSKTKFIPNFLLHNSIPIYDPSQRADLLNQFFNSTFYTRSNFILPAIIIDELPTPTDQMSSITINTSVVYTALSQLDPNKASGPDNIHSWVLKSCVLALTEPLTSLFSTSLVSSSIPKEWKFHKIIPVPKKGDLSDVKNYRPISLLSCLSKVLERIIYDQILPFIRPKLSPKQYGFLKNRSCLSQLLISYSDILNSIENKNCADTIYLDFSKAFDSVPHQELLLKLWRMGITGPLWCWFKDYLENRVHYVSIDIKSALLFYQLSLVSPREVYLV